MSRLFSPKIFYLLILLPVNYLQAQTDKQEKLLLDAIRAKDPKKALELVKLVNNVNYCNESGESSLMWAASFNYVELCKILINKGAKIDQQNHAGLTPVMGAVGNRAREVLKLLVEKGANLNIQSNDGYNASIFAVNNKDLETLRILVENGANIEIGNYALGTNLFTFCAYIGFTEGVKLLLENGAKIDQLTKYGETALIISARNGDAETVKVLLNKGADPYIKYLGKTAFDYAKNEEIKNIIVSSNQQSKQDKTKISASDIITFGLKYEDLKTLQFYNSDTVTFEKFTLSRNIEKDVSTKTIGDVEVMKKDIIILPALTPGILIRKDENNLYIYI